MLSATSAAQTLVLAEGKLRGAGPAPEVETDAMLARNYRSAPASSHVAAAVRT